jgi:predicted ester cyclase
VTGIDIDRVSGGNIVEHWSEADTLGIMQQLGAVPEGRSAKGT